MRILRLGICTAATAVVLCLVAVSPLFIFTSPFRRFMGKDPMYHAEIARACDSVMRQHPLGTNAAIVSVAGGDESILLLDVPLSDPSLPKVIRDLRPSKITISKNRIHMIVDLATSVFRGNCK
jgi:hypothetical protein